MMYFPRFIYANTQYICTEKDSKMRREGEGGLRHWINRILTSLHLQTSSWYDGVHLLKTRQSNAGEPSIIIHCVWALDSHIVCLLPSTIPPRKPQRHRVWSCALCTLPDLLWLCVSKFFFGKSKIYSTHWVSCHSACKGTRSPWPYPPHLVPRLTASALQRHDSVVCSQSGQADWIWNANP